MKKYIFIVITVIFIIFIFFLNFYYKNFLNGNNKSKEKIIENILSEDLSYNADILITVYSNKNQNEYEISLEETNEKSYLEVIEADDIQGLVLEYEGNTLLLKNTDLNLQKIFEDYNELSWNYLFLKTFIKEYYESENVDILEDEEKIVIKIEIKNSNKYIKYKELYVNRETGLPTELIIKSSDKQNKVCIKYISVQIFQ